MVFLPEDHPEMIEAKRKAKESLPEFKKLLEGKDTTKENFAVKVEFPLEEGSEHIWVSELELQGDCIKGKISNDPNELKDLEYGSEVTVKDDAITDWAYSENDYFHGHFTTRVLIPHMNKRMKEQVLDIYGWRKEFS